MDEHRFALGTDTGEGSRRATPRVRPGQRLEHAILINVSYPCTRNRRGTMDLPEMPVGAATLPLLASLVRMYRPGCRIHQYDEIGTPIDFHALDALPRERSLVLMSASTNLAYEARRLSRALQELGFAVVIGGPHASACLDEVAGYANAAVHGEAEVHMESLIQAFESGALSVRTRPGLELRAERQADLTRSPLPDRSLYRASENYMNPGVLEFGRGCQYRCSFCASTNLYADALRHKNVAQVLAEIETLPVYPFGYRFWFFGDDNFCSSHARASQLAEAIGHRFPRARWGCAMTIASARDPRLLDALVAGGMRYAFIGFDSIVQESLSASRKRLSKARHFTPLADELKRRGVFVVAALVFGFEHDRVSVFRETLEWAVESGVDVLNLNVLRPYPSSPDYRALAHAGRLLYDPWWLQSFETRLDMVHGLTASISSVMTTFRPQHMSAEELARGTLWVGQQFFKPRRTLPRLWRNRQNLATLVVDGLTNYSYAKHYMSHQPVTDPALG